MIYLGCDLGGTKVLIGVYEKNTFDNVPKLITREKYSSSEWDSFYSILDDFFKRKYTNNLFPKTACFGIAGPVKNNSAKITNLNWDISIDNLKRKYKFENVDLINDFAVLPFGIPYLSENQYITIQEGEKQNGLNNNLNAIVGAGTGLGIARGLISKNNIVSFSSEGGHMEYAPKSNQEWELKTWLKRNLNFKRISCERIISGEGLSNIAKWRFSKEDLKNHKFTKVLKDSEQSFELKKNLSAEICKMAREGDPVMREIEEMWINIYASFLGDIALHELCYGGLWISGGTATKHLENFCSENFLKHFLNKGRLKDIVKSIPLKVILDEEFGLHSAACRANFLLINSKK